MFRNLVRPDAGEEIGAFREGFPGVYYAESPLHPAHFEAGRFHSSQLTDYALELGLNPVSGGRAYTRSFTVLKILAREQGTLHTHAPDGSLLPWQQSLNITSGQFNRMSYTLIDTPGLERAYIEARRRNVQADPMYLKVLASFLESQEITRPSADTDIPLFDLES